MISPHVKVTYRVPWEDFDYEGWADQHGLEGRLEPAADGGFLLHIEGPESAVDEFSAVLSWGPES